MARRLEYSTSLNHGVSSTVATLGVSSKMFLERKAAVGAEGASSKLT